MFSPFGRSVVALQRTNTAIPNSKEPSGAWSKSGTPALLVTAWRDLS